MSDIVSSRREHPSLSHSGGRAASRGGGERRSSTLDTMATRWTALDSLGDTPVVGILVQPRFVSRVPLTWCCRWRATVLYNKVENNC